MHPGAARRASDFDIQTDHRKMTQIQYVSISPEVMEVLYEGMICFHLLLQMSMLVIGASKEDLGFLSLVCC